MQLGLCWIGPVGCIFPQSESDHGKGLRFHHVAIASQPPGFTVRETTPASSFAILQAKKSPIDRRGMISKDRWICPSIEQQVAKAKKDKINRTRRNWEKYKETDRGA